MRLTRERMIAAFLGRDATADGRFFTAVVTTGIYCLPSCAAKKARPENVRFFETRPEARAAGFRPCRRCRPDAFPGDRDGDAERLARAAAEVRRNPSAFASTADIGRLAAAGTTKLSALFRAYYHTTPAAYLTRARVAAAARALHDRRIRTADAAFAAGFESLSAFNENFLRIMCIRPSEYRAHDRSTRFVLRLPADYRPEHTLRIVGRDPDSPAERVDARRLVKVLARQAGPLRLDVSLERGRARCEVTAANDDVAPDDVRRAHAVALRLLGLHLDPAPFERRVARSRPLRPLVNGRAGLRLPLTADPFEALAWAIVGQQVNLPFAYRLRRTVIELAGSDAGGGLRAHPTAEHVARLDYSDLTTRQFSRRKAEYLIDTARAASDGALPLDALESESAPAIEKRLDAVRGIGPWSTQYALMRGFGFADCVPAGDSGLATALARFFDLDERPNPRETRTLMEAFAPYRSLATFHLWTSLGAAT